MGFLKRLHAAFSNKAFENYVKAWHSGADMANLEGGGRPSKETALRYSAFFACNRVLAETFASVSIHEYKQDAKTGDREKTDDTGLFQILHFTPNSETSRFNFQESLMYQINIGGNFVAERLMRGRRIASFAQIPWENYDIYRDSNDKRLKYRVRNGSDQVVLDRSEVLHIPGPSMEGFIGMSLLTYAAATIEIGSGYNSFSKKFYKNSATPSGVFEMDGFLNDQAYKDRKEEIKKLYTGLRNAGQPMLLENGMKYKPVTINPIDAELLSSRKFQVEDICRFFRVQPHLIQHLEKSTNNNIEMQSLEFVMYTMLPHFKRVEDSINSQLLTPRQRLDGYYLQYNMASLLRGDQKSMSEAFSKGIQWGWYSVNDVRRILNLNRVDNGDTHLMPLNMAPLGTGLKADSLSNKLASHIDGKVAQALDEAAKKGTI